MFLTTVNLRYDSPVFFVSTEKFVRWKTRSLSVYKKWLKKRRPAQPSSCRSLPVCLGGSCRSRAPGWIFCCGAAGPLAWRAGRSPGHSCRSQRCSTGSYGWSLQTGTEEEENTDFSTTTKCNTLPWCILKHQHIVIWKYFGFGFFFNLTLLYSVLQKYMYSPAPLQILIM